MTAEENHAIFQGVQSFDQFSQKKTGKFHSNPSQSLRAAVTVQEQSFPRGLSHLPLRGHRRRPPVGNPLDHSKRGALASAMLRQQLTAVTADTIKPIAL